MLLVLPFPMLLMLQIPRPFCLLYHFVWKRDSRNFYEFARMPSLRTLFRSKERSKSAQPRSRVPWTRLRHAHSATAPLNQQPAPTAPTEGVQAPEAESHEGDANVSHEEIVNNNDASQVEPPVAEEPEPEPARNSNDADSASRSQHGSKRFKNIMARFRSSKSADHSSVSEPLHLPEPQDTPDPATTTTDPVKKDIPSRNPSAVDRTDQEQKRNVSAQTAASQESNRTTVTVCRHPSQRISMSLDESQDGWLGKLVGFEKDIAHMLEPSDPFSDGKNAELRCEAVSSSRHSEDQGLEQIEQSSKKSQSGSIQNPPSKSRGNSRDELAQRGSRTSSGSSHASRGSRISRLDPSKANIAFNVLATKVGLQLSIATEDPPTGHGKSCLACSLLFGSDWVLQGAIDLKTVCRGADTGLSIACDLCSRAWRFQRPPSRRSRSCDAPRHLQA